MYDDDDDDDNLRWKIASHTSNVTELGKRLAWQQLILKHCKDLL